MTNTIKHHLTDELLMAYSAGTLPEAFNLVVATHISMCDECRARLMSFDAIGGGLLEENTVDMGADSLAQTMALIAAKQTMPLDNSPVIQDSVFPKPLQDYIGGDLSAVKWKRAGLGVRQAILNTEKGATARLLYIPAGSAVPDHGHRGLELTLVLQGAFRDDVDHFGKGDIEVAGEELDHTPIADIGEDCICLAATDAPLRFNSFLPKVAQPFLRI